MQYAPFGTIDNTHGSVLLIASYLAPGKTCTENTCVYNSLLFSKEQEISYLKRKNRCLHLDIFSNFACFI